MERIALRFRTKSSSTAASKPSLHVKDSRFNDLPWYSSWVLQQVEAQPQRLFLALPETKKILETGQKSIDSITDKLVKQGALVVTDDYLGYQSARDLVFSIIGWQTMLYRPDFPSGPLNRFSIADEMSGHRGEAHLSLTQDGSSSKRDLSEFLLGFGMMIPSRDYCAFEDDDDKVVFHQTKTIVAKDVDAYVLSKVCALKLQWVDCLSCHLELDKHSNTLFLYRYPSFCVSSLEQRSTNGPLQSSVIHSCVMNRDPQAGKAWVPHPQPYQTDEKDATELLREILLSYRLIFGQSGKSRKIFWALHPFHGVPRESQDRLLPELCTRKRVNCGISLVEREEYNASADFPHLRSRLVRLNQYASTKRPRSLKQLWLDKRDSAAWLTFWTVLAFGCVGILLGLVQTVFAILQYVQASQQN